MLTISFVSIVKLGKISLIALVRIRTFTWPGLVLFFNDLAWYFFRGKKYQAKLNLPTAKQLVHSTNLSCLSLRTDNIKITFITKKYDLYPFCLKIVNPYLFEAKRLVKQPKIFLVSRSEWMIKKFYPKN